MVKTYRQQLTKQSTIARYAGWTSTTLFVLCFSATLAQINNYVPAGNCGVMRGIEKSALSVLGCCQLSF
jgi:hypothetical protein